MCVGIWSLLGELLAGSRAFPHEDGDSDNLTMDICNTVRALRTIDPSVLIVSIVVRGGVLASARAALFADKFG